MTDPSGGSGTPPENAPPPSAETRPRAQSAADQGVAFPGHVRAARSEFEQHVAQARAEFDQANERIKQRTGRDLIVAVVIGLAIGVVVLSTLLFFKWIFVIFAAAAVSLGIFEFTRALQASGRRVDLVPQLIAGLGLLAAGAFLGVWVHWSATLAAVAFVLVWRIIAQMAARDGRAYGDVLADVLTAGFVQLYVPFLGSLCLILLSEDRGEWWVLAFLIVTVVADTGAYVTGITIGRSGRHRMAPRISPSKTWEGFAGAFLAALVAGVLLALFMLGLPWWAGLVFGAVILGTATAGDLGESMIKRDLGIKDMSSWLPGHGGVLDRLDSILPSATAALALYYLLSPLVVS